MMITFSLLSSREKKIFFVVAGMLVILLIDLAFRAWGAVLVSIKREETRLKAQWDYSSGFLARSRNIDERYSGLRSRFPKLFEDDQDPTRLMAELDEAAKASGVQVTMMRPTQPSEESKRNDAGVAVSRFEMAFRGSWPQMMHFFQIVENRDHLFQFSSVSVHRQERTGELEISATVQK
jgi:hypothetical protein